MEIVGAALLGAIFALAANKITGAGVNPGQYANYLWSWRNDLTDW